MLLFLQVLLLLILCGTTSSRFHEVLAHFLFLFLYSLLFGVDTLIVAAIIVVVDETRISIRIAMSTS